MCAQVKPERDRGCRGRLVMSSNILSAVRLRPREPRGFQRLRRFSQNPNIYNNLGNLLSLKQQPWWLQQMRL
jgi:hypothetical protein